MSRPCRWDVNKGRKLWLEGMLLEGIAKAVSVGLDKPIKVGAVKSIARRYRWGTRRNEQGGNRTLREAKIKARRCYECLAPYDATNPHECKGRAVSPRLGLGWAA